MKKEEILLKVRSSRKSYIFYYFLIILVIFGIIYFYINNKIGVREIIVGVIIIVFLIKFIEVHRIRDWWAITDSSLIESKGLVNKNIREVEFNSIVDIDLTQEFYKRFMGYGTVSIRKLLNERTVVIKNINDPEKFINILHVAITKAKNK